MKVRYLGCDIWVPSRYATKVILRRFKRKVYEIDEINFLKRYVKPTDTVLELGACLGVTSVITNKLLAGDAKKKHTVIEANSELIGALNKTKKMNKSEFSIIHCIIGEKPLKFYVYNKVVAGSAHREDNKESGKREVIVNNLSLPKLGIYDVLIIDIEGGELEFLKTYHDYIEKNVNTIVVEIHGHLMNNPKFNNECFSIIAGCGLIPIDKKGNVYVFVRPISILQ